MAGEQIIGARRKQRAQIHRQMAMYDGKPLFGNREFPTPPQTCRPMFEGSVLQNRDHVAIPVAKREVKRQYCALSDDVGADKVAAVNEHFSPLGTQQIHRTACALNLVVSVRQDAEEQMSPYGIVN